MNIQRQVAILLSAQSWTLLIHNHCVSNEWETAMRLFFRVWLRSNFDLFWHIKIQIIRMTAKSRLFPVTDHLHLSVQFRYEYASRRGSACQPSSAEYYWFCQAANVAMLKTRMRDVWMNRQGYTGTCRCEFGTSVLPLSEVLSTRVKANRKQPRHYHAFNDCCSHVQRCWRSSWRLKSCLVTEEYYILGCDFV